MRTELFEVHILPVKFFFGKIFNILKKKGGLHFFFHEIPDFGPHLRESDEFK